MITDLIIVSSVMFILLHLEKQNSVIALISLSGALYLTHLGIASLRTKSINRDISDQKKASLRKGILANFLNPHPYLFWITIGGPILFKTFKVNVLATFLFVAGFYVFLVGSKIMIAFVVGRYRSFLKNKYYLYTIRGLGVVYLVFALFFIEQGLKLLGFYI